MAYEHKTYPTGYVELEAGRYTRAEIKALLDWFDATDAALKRSMQPTEGDPVQQLARQMQGTLDHIRQNERNLVESLGQTPTPPDTPTENTP